MEMSEPDLANLAARLTKRTLAKGAYLYYPGTPSLHLYVVESGLIRQFFCNANGQEFLANLVGPRSAISFPLLKDDQMRAMGAAAHKTSVVLSLEREDLLYFMERSRQLARNVYQDLTTNMLRLMFHVQSLTTNDLNTRLAVLIVFLTQKAPNFAPEQEYDLPVNQTEIAAWLGASRGQLNRALSRMQQAGILRLKGQKLQILDYPRLEKMTKGLLFG